jgi:hypothetical protein
MQLVADGHVALGIEPESVHLVSFVIQLLSFPRGGRMTAIRPMLSAGFAE